jgi:S1-C subfamily serine protease
VDVATLITGGLGVGRVVRGDPAANAGLQAGDVIVAVAGERTDTAGALECVLATLRPGQRVPVQVIAVGGKTESVDLVLGQAPGR